MDMDIPPPLRSKAGRRTSSRVLLVLGVLAAFGLLAVSSAALYLRNLAETTLAKAVAESWPSRRMGR